MQPFVVKYADFSITNLVDSEETFHSSVRISFAKDKAREANLDLVCFNKPSNGKPALCKIVDFGKWKYYQKKSEKKEKQNAKKETKELRFTPVIGEHDLDHKIKQIIEFLENDDDVLITMRFKGIHRRLKDVGKQVVDDIINRCKDYGKESHRKQDNNSISVRIVKQTVKEK